MRMLGQKMIVYRGETFKYCAKIYKSDNVTPFILMNDIPNPYLLISIASNNLTMKGKYLSKHWIDLSTYASFRENDPLLVEQRVIDSNSKPSTYGKNDDGKDCVVYVQESNGNKSYYYWLNNTYKEYSFVFGTSFTNLETRNWIESKYSYELQLLGGDKTFDILLDMFNTIYPNASEIPDDPRTLYEKIEKCRPDLVEKLCWSCPICNYYTVDIIRKPTELIIESNI